MNIILISGSTRLSRLSHRVTLALEQKIREAGHSAEILDLAAYNFPVFEEVLAKLPDPPAGLREFSEKIRQADAAIFISPEYNGGYSSALKNAVDYLKDREFSGKVVGVASVSSGVLGGIRAALNMQELVLGVGGYAIPQMLTVGEISRRFDETGGLLDPGFAPKMAGFLNSFLWLAAAVFEKKQVASPW